MQAKKCVLSKNAVRRSDVCNNWSYAAWSEIIGAYLQVKKKRTSHSVLRSENVKENLHVHNAQKMWIISVVPQTSQKQIGYEHNYEY